MEMNGIGSRNGYDFYSVSQESFTKTGETQSKEQALALGRQQENRFVEQEKEAQEKKTQETQEKKRSERVKQAQQAVQDTYDKLSDRAKEYLKELQSKYGNLDFFVADVDSEEQAQQIMSSGDKTFSVLMDSATLEEMAADSSVAQQYESLIETSVEELTQLGQDLSDNGITVRNLGMKLDAQGNTTYYSIIDDSLSYYEKALEKQEKKREERAEEKKEEQRRQEYEEQRQEELEEQQENYKDTMERQLGGRYALVTAGTIEELRNRLHLEEDKVLRLRNQNIPVGIGADFTV